MCFDTLTPDEFMHLTPFDHLLALAEYAVRIGAAEARLAGPVAAPEAQRLRAELGGCRSLRKLHAGRLQEQLYPFTRQAA